MLLTCAGEEVVAVFVEGNGHDSVCKVECFLYSVTVVDVYVQVQYTRMIPAAVLPTALQHYHSISKTKLPNVSLCSEILPDNLRCSHYFWIISVGF